MTKLAKFKDSIEHPKKNSVCLLTVISLDQAYQQGDNFKIFCDLLNQEYKLNKTINKLIVLETGFLKRHYIRLDPKFSIEDADKQAINWGKDWIKRHEIYLEELQFPYEIKSWEELTKKSLSDEKEIGFSHYLDKIKLDYEKEDLRLKDLVNALSRSYAIKLVDEWDRKGVQLKFDLCFQASKNYLLEEGAIIFELVKLDADYITYPDRSNPVLKYIYKKYLIETDPLPWKRYQIVVDKEIQKINTNSNFSSVNILKLKESINFTLTHICYDWDDVQTKRFYKDFVSLISKVDKKKVE